MPRPRVTELPQRQSPRNQLNLRTSSPDSDPSHHRPRPERSPKLAEGRSPRGSQSDTVSQKKLGTRIADLESQLGQAQQELKSLKTQLTSAEVAKKAGQEQLEKKPKKHQKVPEPAFIKEKQHYTPIENQAMNKKENGVTHEISNAEKETDVFEVPVQKVTVVNKNESDLPDVKDELKENLLIDEAALKNDEMKLLMSKLEEKEKELEVFCQENENLKGQVNEKSIKISSAESELEKLKTKMKNVDEELEKSKKGGIELKEKLEASEKAKEELENEMRMLRVQTEQWRKAADAAASVLAGGVDMNGRRISERCGSMDKHYGYGSVFEHGGYGVGGGYVGLPRMVIDNEDVFGSGKRKGSGSGGMRMFGDLWKKKGQK